jgi:hypothetical protein
MMGDVEDIMQLPVLVRGNIVPVVAKVILYAHGLLDSLVEFQTKARRKMIGRYSSSIALLGVLAGALSSVNGFVAPPSTTTATRSRSGCFLFDAPTGYDNFCVEVDENRAGLQTSPEMARRYRRTVYTHDDWKKHRQSDRFLIYLGSMFRSGVFENSKNEVLLTTAFAAIICVYNGLAGGYTGLDGVAYPATIPGQVIGLPINAFTVTGSSLSLLLSKFDGSCTVCVPWAINQ